MSSHAHLLSKKNDKLNLNQNKNQRLLRHKLRTLPRQSIEKEYFQMFKLHKQLLHYLLRFVWKRIQILPEEHQLKSPIVLFINHLSALQFFLHYKGQSRANDHLVFLMKNLSQRAASKSSLSKL